MITMEEAARALYVMSNKGKSILEAEDSLYKLILEELRGTPSPLMIEVVTKDDVRIEINIDYLYELERTYKIKPNQITYKKLKELLAVIKL